MQDVCKKPLEDFVPAYVGRELALAEKKKAIQARKNASFLSGPQFMEHWMGFWLSHGIYGLISVQAFCTAIAVQTKLLSQQGPAFAVKYFRA